MQPLPIDSLSYSRIRLYLSNKIAFWRHYVLKDKEPIRTATMVEGSILHEMLEYMVGDALLNTGGAYVRGAEESDTLSHLDGFIAAQYPTIDRQGATLLTEAHIRTHGQRVAREFEVQLNKYLKKEKAVFTHVEHPMSRFIKDVDGMSFPLPFVSRVDAISMRRNPDAGKRDILTIHDWKMVRTTRPEHIQKNTFLYMFQAIPYYLVALQEFPGYTIEVMYHFFKTTETQKPKTKKAMEQYVSYLVPPIGNDDITAFCFLVELLLKDIRGQRLSEGSPILLPDVFHDVYGRANWESFKHLYQSYIS